ncbi:DUF4132 domain-containing protein [Streptomyces reniochalinae]|uniref:DUF4132 domain-containing protein n=1 Tax=Streptomyces reniochalinae TaxID=2250578 RepID=A0A367EDK4_9ACTN|nr:DUF4132 domain-containing protein [Streptomyces reniochalinae]RCG15839.1 DUF4132 domain-containing protein [Streptomyces reniochalinae]
MSDFDACRAAVRAAAERDDASAVHEALASVPELSWAVELLRPLPEYLRLRTRLRADEAYRQAETEQQRAANLYLRVSESPELAALGPRELEDVVRAAVARKASAAACERAIGRVQLPWVLLDVLPDDARHRLLRHCAERYHDAETPEQRDQAVVLHAMASAGRPDDLMAADRQRLLAGWAGNVQYTLESYDAAWVELASGRQIPSSLGAEIRRAYHDSQPIRTTASREVLRLLAERHPVLNAGERWSDHALAELAKLPAAWTDVLRHAATLTSVRPGAPWARTARALLAEVEAERFLERVADWLALLGGPPTLPRERGFAYDPYNYEVARGLVWTLTFLPGHARAPRALGAVLDRALRRVPGVGPGMPKLANACATALCTMEGEAALAELARLTTRVTYKATLKILQAGLDTRARDQGLGREEIEELAVPSYGLSPQDGRRVVHFGDEAAEATAELVIDGGTAVLRWRNAAGKPVASVPAAVRRDHASRLKELRAEVKEINATLGAVARRLDRALLTRRSWPAQVWRERYLEHPLVGTVARRLLWTLDGTACRHTDGALRDLTGEPVTGQGTVRLWHPVGRPVEEVMAWRRRLEDERITQPFKQAHREVYLLTDAERRTATYSNRFAGHILGQHRFRSLAAQRGWHDAELRICHHDTSYPPAVRELSEWGLRAEYWVRGEGESGNAPTTDSGAYTLLATDQVRFYPIDAPGNTISSEGRQGFCMPGPEKVDPVPLEEIPARVLSEVLRDVDLFVGVASVAGDPTWQDGGPGGHYARYWSSVGFGELSETARTRHDLLARLLPRLAIGDRCHVEGRFLHVKGDLHTYRIHLGSGNVLLDSGDRYLCVVAKSEPSSSPHVYLPFDGDWTLSVILSKALMLADDTRITDPVLLEQLRG